MLLRLLGRLFGLLGRLLLLHRLEEGNLLHNLLLLSKEGTQNTGS